MARECKAGYLIDIANHITNIKYNNWLVTQFICETAVDKLCRQHYRLNTEKCLPFITSNKVMQFDTYRFPSFGTSIIEWNSNMISKFLSPEKKLFSFLIKVLYYESSSFFLPIEAHMRHTVWLDRLEQSKQSHTTTRTRTNKDTPWNLG